MSLLLPADTIQATAKGARRRPRRRNVTLLGWAVAGNRTHFESIRDVAHAWDGISARSYAVQAHKPGGLIERLPIPQNVRGQLRAFAEAWPTYLDFSAEAVWTSCTVPAFPLALRRRLFGHPALAMTMDATPIQLAAMAAYYQTIGHGSKSWHLAAVKALYRTADVLNPWSNWAAESLVRDYGIPAGRIHVIPPGVDLSVWRPARRTTGEGRRVRLLFVGADFERKGGDVLVDVYHRFFRETCELHLVTRAAVTPGNGVHVYRSLMPNDPDLRALYASADIFVLPTRADCFSVASIEAMACGLPVITSAVGGIPEIFSDDTEGLLVQPDNRMELRSAVARLVAEPQSRAQLGAAARIRVEKRFDGKANAHWLLRVLSEAADLPEQRRSLSRTDGNHRR